MRYLKKIVKWTSVILGGSILLLIVTIAIMMKFSPQFGAEIPKEQKEQFESLDHYEEGKFLNAEPFEIKLDCHNVTEMLKDAVSSHPNIKPEKNIEVVKFDVAQINKNLGNKTRVTWLGHSSFLIEIEGKTILIDPVFGDYAAPHKLLGRKRYNSEMSFNIEDLETIDAVIISHDHYDHLDYPTIKKIKDKIQHVIVPLGVGNHFKKWGVDPNIIQELDWWEETQLDSLKIVLTPSRHSSGRGLSDQSATLWGSWCFLGTHQKIFFSGDGGYGKHFKEIGTKYGPFDFGMIECGQYDKHWAGMHMVPEESVQAGIDAGAKTIMPIHWGCFTLANHTWIDPVERFTKKAVELKIETATPQIGESILLKSNVFPHSTWWEKFD
jgi:L-ascorbate metabolism protein UlaG (beta-lactamase superfamily)